VEGCSASVISTTCILQHAVVCWVTALCLLGYFASWACLLGYFPSWAILPLGLASWATLPLGLFCLLGYFASWAALPPGLLCLLGLPLRLFQHLPLGPCLINIVCFDNAGILVCLLGCANLGHLLVCQLISHVNMSNRDTL
jgi:hypothetical protein